MSDKVVGAVAFQNPDGHTHIHVFKKLDPRKCELCGAVEECRPYGPNGEWICYECGQKDIEATKAAFHRTFSP